MMHIFTHLLRISYHKVICMALMCLFPGIVLAISPRDIKRQFKSAPGKSGGIYYAYPYTTDSIPKFPEGYEPVYISHYGRHGSRWAINEKQYPLVLDILTEQQQLGNLTREGEEVMHKVKIIADHAKGHAGELSPLGQRQHKGIAERMMKRTPELFADTANISALSSIVPRCIISMSAFTERLKELNPSLQIARSASPGDMDFIAFSTPEARKVDADSLGWRADHKRFREKIVPQERLMKVLFKETPTLEDPVLFLKTLHDIAVTTQNVELNVDLLCLFTTDELFAFWQALNYNMYVRHANSPEGKKAGMYSARSLLDDIITRADKALGHAPTVSAESETTTKAVFISEIEDEAGIQPKVQLRFGHDTNLIRLLALMQLAGCAESESDPKQYYA
ncbi:MAG: histidine phosphatase family protein, partial [Muribaculaceae bacterium]|nr:histidine phosphatase family protein [Muribaculaceae bacterium]